MISKQARVMSITNRGSHIYNLSKRYDINYNLKITDTLSSVSVYKDNKYQFSACIYYSYYVILYLLDEDLERKAT